MGKPVRDSLPRTSAKSDGRSRELCGRLKERCSAPFSVSRASALMPATSAATAPRLSARTRMSNEYLVSREDNSQDSRAFVRRLREVEPGPIDSGWTRLEVRVRGIVGLTVRVRVGLGLALGLGSVQGLRSGSRQGTGSQHMAHPAPKRFFRCCTVPRHRSRPAVMIPTRVHSASHSSMLWLVSTTV